MIKIEALKHLHVHNAYLKEVFKKTSLFFVGGGIRDLLLWFTTLPTDIDITSGGNPQDIFKQLKGDSYHLFRTEKFGTMTVLPKEVTLPGYEKDAKIQYELTPFRTEGGYADFRHPQEIERSNDLVADSKRRDFTINAMYVHIVDHKDIYDKKTGKTWAKDAVSATISSDEELAVVLEKNTSIFFKSCNVLLLQDQACIASCFPEGVLDSTALLACLENTLSVDSPMLWTSPHDNDSVIILIDPHKGLQDLLSKTISTVGDPHQRFGEDALRILRGVRFVNILNYQLFYGQHAHYTPDQALQQKNTSFDLSPETRHAMKKNYYLVSYLPKERIKDEITKVFSKGNPFGYISLLEELNLLKFLFPALAATKNIPQPVRYHTFDIYAHTMLVVHELCQYNADYLVRLATLYHDVGKTDQYYYFSQHISREEKKLPITHQMYHAQMLWPQLAERDFKELGFSNKDVETICRYIKYHHRPGELLEITADLRTKKLRQMLSEVGPEMLYNLMDIAIADRRGQYNPLQPPATAQLYAMKDEIKQLYEEEGRFLLKDLAVDGDMLMQELKLTPSPLIWELLEKAFNRVLSDIKARNTKAEILVYLKSLTIV